MKLVNYNKKNSHTSKYPPSYPNEMMVKIISSSAGAINESDIALAEASNAMILGFNVRADSQARKIVAEKKIDLR